MSRQSKPAIAIDPIKNVIRIHKTTLFIIGKPDYIQLLVNPSSMQIAIKASNKNDYLAHHVRWHELSGTKSYQLHSQKLLEELFKFNNDFNKKMVYRIYGDYYENEGVVKFDFNDAKAEKVKVINNGRIDNR